MDGRSNALRRVAMIAVACAIVAGCASPDLLRVGMTREQLDARFGTPSFVRREGGDEVRIYTAQPLGFTASAVRIAPDGRVVSVEPLLDTEHFARIGVNTWTKQDVLDRFGPPAEVRGTLRYPVVWSYRYREAGVWYSLFSIMFDAGGVVRETQNGPDPMYDPTYKPIR